MNQLGTAANVLQVIGFITGGSLLGWMAWGLRRLTRSIAHDVLHEIRTATYPIQPHANGGNSLPDLAKKIDGIALQVAEINGSLHTHLDWHNGS